MFSGSSRGGGGAGGRMAVILTEHFMFRGSLKALGGSGTLFGSPGTVYIEMNIGERLHKILRIDNIKRSENYKVYLAEAQSVKYDFDEVHLVNMASITIKQVSI